MRSSMMGFEVQKRSLQVAQKSLDITAHNMGNMSKPGYTRQRVDTASLALYNYSYWQTPLSRLSIAGQGVTAKGVSQIRNEYLDKRYRDYIPFASELDVKISIMEDLETALDNIDNFGLLGAFNKFKSALQQVSLERPDAKEMASLVRNEAVNICSMLRSYSAELDRMLENNVLELSESIDRANILIGKIVNYNKAITDEYLMDASRIFNGQGVSEYGPLEMLDERNLLLDQLAEFGDIEVKVNVNGSVKVTLAGHTIIDDEKFEMLSMKSYTDYDAAVVVFSDGTEFKPKNGEIKGYMDMVNGNGAYTAGKYQNGEHGIPYYRVALDVFASGFASLMNEVNKGDTAYVNQWDRALFWGGYEMNADGTHRVDSDGNYVKALVDAANIRVTDEWLANELMIGETFTARSIDYYALNRDYNYGDVFRDPASGNYYVVNAAAGYTSDGVQKDYNNGDIVRVNVYPDAEAAFSPTKTDYAVGDKFFDTNTGLFFEVKTATGAVIDIKTAMASGEIAVIGVKEGEWQPNNLDGGNLHRFVAALEANRQWGNALDFNGSVYGYLEFLSNRLGQGIDQAQKQFDVIMDTVTTVLDNRDAISSVSDTEEGINMLTYQKWFNASSRLMTTMDEALDTIINRMGRVGL